MPRRQAKLVPLGAPGLLPEGVRIARQLHHVETGLERRAGTRVDDDQHLRIGIELLPCRLELGQHGRVHGVAGGRPVEHQPAQFTIRFRSEFLDPASARGEFRCEWDFDDNTLKETGWEVALELWGPRANLYEKRLALQEGLAHLQALAVDSRVSKSVTPASVRWTPA